MAGTRTARRATMAAALASVMVASCGARAPSRPGTRSGDTLTRESRGGEVVVGAGRIARVALTLGAVSAVVGGSGKWHISDESGRELLAHGAAGDAWRVERRGTQLRAVGTRGATPWHDGPLVARPADGESFVTHNGRRWRGELWVHASSTGVTVVNRVAVEEYLRGVVPLELNTFAPSDVAALQAQAVAARSYVYGRLPEFAPRDIAIRQAALPYDLRATVSDQVYGGVDAERNASDRAVATTAGLVLRYGGAVVTAPYFSACGGSTAEPGELWTSPGEPWLRRVSDRMPGTDRHFCDIAPRFRWERTWDEAALRGVLQRYLRATSGVRGAIGAVHAIAIEARTGSGRVAALSLATDVGRATLRGNDIRFAVRTVGGDILPSTYFSVDTERDGGGRVTHVTIRGNGNGHGVGMCQWGAVGRARAGHDFRAILRAYYPNTTVEPAE